MDANNVKTILAFFLLAGVAIAGTVSYLSNSATASVTVSSPFEIAFAGGATTQAITAYGGDTVNFTATIENKANNPVYAVSKLTCNDGNATMDCTQLSISHNYTVIAGSSTGISHNDGVLSCANGTGTAIYTIQPGYNFPAGHKSVDDFQATVGSTVLGTINCVAQATP